MDIVFLIIVWCFVLYLVFGNQTKKKYKKGLSAMKSRDLDLAENYFQQIVKKHPEAKSKLEEIIFKRGLIAEESDDLNLAYDYFSSIQNKNTEAGKRLILIDLVKKKIYNK